MKIIVIGWLAYKSRRRLVCHRAYIHAKRSTISDTTVSDQHLSVQVLGAFRPLSHLSEQRYIRVVLLAA